MGKVWERQEKETAKAYDAFTRYLRLGRNRTMQSVCNELDMSRTNVGRWKKRYNWDERAREYDNSFVREEHSAVMNEVREMAKRHIKIAMMLQQKAIEALQKLTSSDLEPKDIKEYLKLATELERLNRVNTAEEEIGEDTDVVIMLPEKDEE